VSGWAAHERAALADALTDLGPDAPTLCEGWLTRDLAAHVYVREQRLDAAPGVLGGPLAAYTARVMASVLRVQGYRGLVEAIRTGPVWLRLTRLDDPINTVEFFVHTEDARRPAGLAPRSLPEAFERAVWSRLRRQARLSFRRLDARARLVPTVGEPVEVGRGTDPLEVRGRPSELVLLAYNRTDAAQVEVSGEPEVAARLRTTKLGL
jgi:uncharacterized protein (TIGR03085 family)